MLKTVTKPLIGCLAALVTAGCGPSTSGPSIVRVTADLQRIGVESFSSVLRDSGIVAVTAFPSDSGLRLREHERVDAVVLAVGGDSEVVRLGPDVCRGSTDYYRCRGIGVSMRQGYHAAILAPLLEAMPGRFTLVSASGALAAIRVLGETPLSQAISQLLSSPGVLSATPDPVGSSGVPSNVILAELSGALALDFLPHVRDNGLIEASSGDTLHVRYRNPVGGNTLTFTVLIP